MMIGRGVWDICKFPVDCDVSEPGDMLLLRDELEVLGRILVEEPNAEGRL